MPSFDIIYPNLPSLATISHHSPYLAIIGRHWPQFYFTAVHDMTRETLVLMMGYSLHKKLKTPNYRKFMNAWDVIHQVTMEQVNEFQRKQRGTQVTFDDETVTWLRMMRIWLVTHNTLKEQLIG